MLLLWAARQQPPDAAPLARRGLPPRVPAPIRPLHFRQPGDITTDPFSLTRRPLPYPGDSAMCCFMVLVNLPADLGLLCMFLQEEKKKKDCVHSSRTFWKNKSSLEATEVARLSLTVRPLRLQTSPAVSCCLRGLCPPASCCCPYLPAARQPWGNCIRLRPGFLTRKTERTGRSLGAARWGVAGRGAGRAREGARCRWRRSRGEGAPWLSAPPSPPRPAGRGRDVRVQRSLLLPSLSHLAPHADVTRTSERIEKL